jgi:hypothetical protein
MNNNDAVAILVHTLGTFLEEPTLTLERQDACSALIENVPFTFFRSEKYNCLFIQALVGNVDHLKNPDAAFAAILSGNHLWAATFGGIFGLEDGNIYYSYRLDPPFMEDSADTELLCDLLPYMVGAIERVQDILETEGDSAPHTALMSDMLDCAILV